VVIFMDFDQYLLAPREAARRSAITAVGKAGRLVGPRREGRGSVVLQTRRGGDPVVNALTYASFDEIIDEEVATTKLLELPPFGATAQVSGEVAQEFVAGLAGKDVSVHATPEGFEIRATEVSTLTKALREAPRPAGKLRIAVQ
jgi:primosomal protein N'